MHAKQAGTTGAYAWSYVMSAAALARFDAARSVTQDTAQVHA